MLYKHIYISLHAPSQVHLPEFFKEGWISVATVDTNIMISHAFLRQTTNAVRNGCCRKRFSHFPLVKSVEDRWVVFIVFQFTSISRYCKQTLRLSSPLHLVTFSFLRIASILHASQHGLRSSCPLHLRRPCGVHYSCWRQEDYWLRVST